jgi:alpha-galactosidase
MLKLAVFTLLFLFSYAYNNGYGEKPFLGWNTWCAIGECGLDLCTDAQIRQTADAFISTGMAAVGYEWIVLDDCWHPTRDSAGVLVPLKSSFPNGMKTISDYVHSKGLKFGLYTSVGTTTCRGDPGSYGYFKQDADLFASWELDYVKMDWCGSNCNENGHEEFSKDLNATGRHIVLELCRGTYQSETKWGYAPQYAQLWRASGDHHDDWNSTLSETRSIVGKSSWSGPYGWAYLDMIMTGGQGCKGQSSEVARHCPGQTNNEYRTEFSIYAISGSPILIGTDVRNFTEIMKELIINPEILAVNQDEKAVPGDQYKVCGGKAEVWARKLSNGKIAVAIPNYGSSTTTIEVCFADLFGSSAKTMAVRDLWNKKDLGNFQTSYSVAVNEHDTVFVTLTPQ